MPQLEIIHLQNAPIAEALIDIRLRHQSVPSLHQLESVANVLAARFPRRQKLNEFLFTMPASEDASAQAQGGQVGFRLESADKTFVVALQPLGLTVSRLPPYTTWDELFDTFRDVWETMKAHIDGFEVIRVGVRYINRLVIAPLPQDYEDYFTSAPRVPDGLPQYVDEFFSRIVIQFQADSSKVILTQAAPIVEAGVNEFRMILDVDAFQENVFAPNDPALWKCCITLRRLKNEVFFSSVTKKTVELFK